MVLCFSKTQLHNIMYKPYLHGMMTWHFSCHYVQGFFRYQLFTLAWKSEWILAWMAMMSADMQQKHVAEGLNSFRMFFSSKFRFHVTNFCPHSPFKNLWSLQNFTHATTAVLSTTVVACAKNCGDLKSKKGISAKWIFHQIWIMDKYHECNGPCIVNGCWSSMHADNSLSGLSIAWSGTYST